MARHLGCGRRLALFMLLATLAGACTSESSDDAGESATDAGDDSAEPAGDAGGAVDAPGVTDDTIVLSLIAADLSLLAEQDLAPELGDPVAAAQATVDEINENGGVAGRQIELRKHVIENLDIINRDVAQTRCIEATEEDKGFAVIVTAAVVGDVVRCVAADHPVLTMSMGTWDEQLYADAEGRLFACCTNTSTGRERQYGAWARMIDEIEPLAEHTVGIVSMDTADQQLGIENGLKVALDDMGVDVSAEAVIPCPEGGSTSCAQHDVAVQRLKDSGADLVFTSVYTTAGVALVQAAEAIGYRPQWVTVGDNTTDTVGKFFAPVYDAWDGALGVSNVFSSISAESDACNEIVATRTGVAQERGTDAYDFTGLVCLQIQVLTDAMDAAPDLSYDSVIAQLESMTDVPTVHGPRGNFGPDKHDAGNALHTVRWDAAQEAWVSVDDETPFEAE